MGERPSVYDKMRIYPAVHPLLIKQTIDWLVVDDLAFQRLGGKGIRLSLPARLILHILYGLGRIGIGYIHIGQPARLQISQANGAILRQVRLLVLQAEFGLVFLPAFWVNRFEIGRFG